MTTNTILVKLKKDFPGNRHNIDDIIEVDLPFYNKYFEFYDKVELDKESLKTQIVLSLIKDMEKDATLESFFGIDIRRLDIIKFFILKQINK